jgi:hypothetical protein
VSQRVAIHAGHTGAGKSPEHQIEFLHAAMASAPHGTAAAMFEVGIGLGHGGNPHRRAFLAPAWAPVDRPHGRTP